MMNRLLTVVMFAAGAGALLGFVLGLTTSVGNTPTSAYAAARWGIDDKMGRQVRTYDGFKWGLTVGAIFAVLAFLGYGAYLLITAG